MRSLFALVAAVVALFAATGEATAQGPAVTREFLIGRWTDTNDCSDAVDFHADGTFLTTDGARGRWTLQGGRLSFIGNSTVAARVHATSRDAITLTHDDGSVGHSTRCPATPASRRTMPPLPGTIPAALAMSRPFAAPFIHGRWTDDGDCGRVIHFHADGRFTVPGGGGGRWQLNGEQLTFIGDRSVSARARAVGNDRIILIHPDNSIGQSLRC